MSINSTGSCISCFGAYALKPDRTGCNPDTSCNSNSSCVICPDGYYLQGGLCQTCSQHANCQACDILTGVNCIKCNDGFYLDSSSLCQSCPANCLTCDSLTYCTKAADGFYIALQDSGAYSGSIAQCQSPCATCADYGSSCLSCISGFSLKGSVCSQNYYLVMTITFGPGTGAGSIFSISDSPNQQLFFGIKSFNTLGFLINNIAPAGFKNDGFSDWRRRFHFRGLRVGSILATV